MQQRLRQNSKGIAVSHSSTESEMVAMEEGIRTEALPTLTFWEHVVQLFCKKRPAGAKAAVAIDTVFKADPPQIVVR